MPPVMVTGESANAVADELVEASGRVVVFDRPVSADSIAAANDISRVRVPFSSEGSLRCVGVLRDADGAPSERQALKRLLETTGVWWVVCSRSGLAGVSGMCTVIRGPGSPVASALLGPRPPAAHRGMSGASIVASGASAREIVQAYASWLSSSGSMDPRDSLELCCRLDTALATNRRPLLMSALIDDAVQDAHDRGGPGGLFFCG